MLQIRKGIVVKYLCCTAMRPQRFVVSCDGIRKTYSAGVINECEAAESFIKDFDLKWKLISGVRVSENVVAFGVVGSL